MKRIGSFRIILVSASLVTGALFFIFSTSSNQVEFSTQVKPLFNKKCISCHGGVKKQGGFSVLFRDEALAKTKSGKYAIVPGDADNSEMIRRLTLDDPEERMPYQHPALSKDEIRLLTRWIDQGAKWTDHWAYIPVKKQVVPSVNSVFGASGENWVRNDIDRFIFHKMKEVDLAPSKEAAPEILARRLALDLTGLPAKQSLRDAYLKNPGGKAYESLVDSLLAEPSYGERWASMWMDVARYADSRGYEADQGRVIWQYRDWLIRAYNEDKPYSQFLIEQIAGDLLPGASDEQLIATAFHRNTTSNNEGGTDNEEFRVSSVLDRVNTTWEGIMGTSFACAQCHSHPYDPFRHEDYYKFMAFFNNAQDEDGWEDYPLLRHFDSASTLKLQLVQNWLEQHESKQDVKDHMMFVKAWANSIEANTAETPFNGSVTVINLNLRKNATTKLKSVDLNSKDELTMRFSAAPGQGSMSFRMDSANGPLLATIRFTEPDKWVMQSFPLKNASGVHDLYLKYENPSIKSMDDNGISVDWFHFGKSLPGKGKAGYKEFEKTYWDLVKMDVPTTPIMLEYPAGMSRKTFVFDRGNWLVKGAEVKPAVPASMNKFPAGAPSNRLGLAQWLTSRDNPLTARTMVNRIWEQVFGKGLVETLEDMGSQGAVPLHPELLDHLSYQFMYEFNWSVKKLLKEIVMSATYRQDSKISRENDIDPDNNYFSRSSRIRLSAEQMRDQALMVSGLLSNKMYGPSVMPYQPEGLWANPWSGEYWSNSTGEDQYRRALYTYLKRTAPYPSMISFDGTARSSCTPRRIRTNTPLQALVTLNDSAFLVMARNFAYTVQKQPGSPQSKIRYAYEAALGHEPAPRALQAMEALYQTALNRYKADTESTCGVIGEMGKNTSAENAAMVVVANAIFNLDEFVTRN